MTPRHAAALALMGWYLITPPVYKRYWYWGDDVVDVNEPLSKWHIFASYDTAKECTDDQNHLLANGAAVLGRDVSSVMKTQDVLSLCIASDDPRLKEK